MYVEKNQVMDSVAMSRAITRISFEILERNKGSRDLCVIGIMSRGVELAHRIAQKIGELEGEPVEVGMVDITAYRDDKRDSATADRSCIPFSIENKRVILVDDVIYTGRSVRAAMDAVLQRGRAQSIQLAALIDRGHRELPIRADYIGKNLPTSHNERIRVMVAERDGEDRVVILGEAEGTPPPETSPQQAQKIGLHRGGSTDGQAFDSKRPGH